MQIVRLLAGAMAVCCVACRPERRCDVTIANAGREAIDRARASFSGRVQDSGYVSPGAAKRFGEFLRDASSAAEVSWVGADGRSHEVSLTLPKDIRCSDGGLELVVRIAGEEASVEVRRDPQQ